MSYRRNGESNQFTRGVAVVVNDAQWLAPSIASAAIVTIHRTRRNEALKDIHWHIAVAVLTTHPDMYGFWTRSALFFTDYSYIASLTMYSCFGSMLSLFPGSSEHILSATASCLGEGVQKSIRKFAISVIDACSKRLR